MGVKPLSTMVLSQAKPNPFKFLVVDPTYSPPSGAICHQKGGDYVSRHIAASNALEECKVGVKPPSTMVLSQAEPNPFKVSIETDLRSHYVRPYNIMSPPPRGGNWGRTICHHFHRRNPCAWSPNHLARCYWVNLSQIHSSSPSKRACATIA